MSYKLSFKDLNQEPEYQLNLNDISPSKNIAQMAENQAERPEEYKPQIQEEFSNPTRMPGFENLSKKERLQRIMMSQFDPANQTATGGFVPPGAYEHPATRMAASILPTLAAPEFAGSGIIPQAANTVMRTGIGALGNTAYESPDIKNMNDFIKSFNKNIKENALLEIPGSASRLVRGGVEYYNPASRYAEQKANDIRNEATSARILQKETYRPVFEKYGDEKVTQNPSSYFSDAGIERNKLYAESKKLYDKFEKNPTFQNLHNLQSKIGSDLRSTSLARNKPATTDLFKQYRNSLQDLSTDFLKKDENALNQYNLGSHITKNLVEPYRANKTLEQISRGKRLNVQPHEIHGAIKKGRERITHRKGNETYTAIPEGHPLENHMNEIEGRKNLSELLKSPIPEALAKWIPNIGKAAQNETLGNIFKKLEKPYLASGRGAINFMNE